MPELPTHLILIVPQFVLRFTFHTGSILSTLPLADITKSPCAYISVENSAEFSSSSTHRTFTLVIHVLYDIFVFYADGKQTLVN